MVVSHPRGGHGHRLFSLKLTIIFILVFILLTLVKFIIIAFGIKYFLVAYVLLYQFLFKPYRRSAYPLAQNCSPLKFLFRPPNCRAIAIALFPLMYPITSATAYFGSVFISICT